MLERVERDFPKLVESGYVRTSEESGRYNCVAFSLGDETQYWWPHIAGPNSDTFWPAGLEPAQETLDSFVSMCATFGFALCDGPEREPGFVKIAIFVGPPDDSPEHVAVRIASGRWISKMGRDEDIAHTLEALEGRPHWWRVGAVVKCAAGAIPESLRGLLDRYGGP